MHATFERNIAQYCCAQHVAHSWPPCCNMLHHVGWRFQIANRTSTQSPVRVSRRGPDGCGWRRGWRMGQRG